MNKRIKDEIARLEKKVKQLQEVYAHDIGESYKEAAQTQELIDQYKIKIINLQKDSEQPTVAKAFELKAEGTKPRVLTVSANSPDPSKGVISVKSEIGKKLMKAKVGAKIQIGDTEYVLSTILPL